MEASTSRDFVRSQLNRKRLHMGDSSVIQANVGRVKWEDHVSGNPGQKQDPISKVTKATKAGCMVQVVEFF
jgi:hypothetical protein